MFITRKHISRRTMIQGLGAAVSLPLLESMLPAMSPAPNPQLRVICLEMVHGAVGSSPSISGREFRNDTTPSVVNCSESLIAGDYSGATNRYRNVQKF